MNNNDVLMAFGLTLIAGLSTGIGSLMAFFTKRTNTRLLSGVLGFSAGVMIYVSLVDILPHANGILRASMGDRTGSWVSFISFFVGILLIAVIDKLIPSFENPHESRRVEQMGQNYCNIKGNSMHLMKMGVLTAAAIGVHNFPEGIATFIAALRDPNLGIAITIAIAIHNIPEGITVSVPIYCATGNRKKSTCLFIYVRIIRAIGSIACIYFFNADIKRSGLWSNVCPCGGYNGFHILG